MKVRAEKVLAEIFGVKLGVNSYFFTQNKNESFCVYARSGLLNATVILKL